MPGCRTTRGLAAATQMAAPAAVAKRAAAAAAADPVGAATTASNFRLAMGVLHAQGRLEFQKVCVYACLLACFIFRTLPLGLLVKILNFRSATQKLRFSVKS